MSSPLYQHPRGMVQNYQPTAEEQQELADLQQYLQGHARNGTLDRIPEGSVNALLNKASPNVKRHMLGSQDVVRNFRDSGGREAPFQPKHDINDLGLDDTLRKVMDRADTEDVTYALNERMGTPTPSADSGPPSIAETMSAAFDLHTPQDN